MTTLRVPALMKYYVNNQAEVELHGTTIAEVLADLISRYPTIRTHIMDSNGNLRRHINLFINDANIKDLDGLQSAVHSNDRIILLPSISGG